MAWEQAGALFLAAGIVCLLGACVWIWILSWRVHWQWGLALTLFPPAGLLFLTKHAARVKVPLVLVLISGMLIGVPFGVNAIVQRVDLGPREKLVDGELHITLTGWDQSDYSVLRSRPAVVVLQMANADVTDETLEHLRGMQRLKELDLNRSQITDRGLELLQDLPALVSLRLQGTKITEDGFRKSLAGRESLLELDVRETAIPSKTLRLWKNAREGRKYLK